MPKPHMCKTYGANVSYLPLLFCRVKSLSLFFPRGDDLTDGTTDAGGGREGRRRRRRSGNDVSLLPSRS